MDSGHGRTQTFRRLRPFAICKSAAKRAGFDHTRDFFSVSKRVQDQSETQPNPDCGDPGGGEPSLQHKVTWLPRNLAQKRRSLCLQNCLILCGIPRFLFTRLRGQ